MLSIPQNFLGLDEAPFVNDFINGLFAKLRLEASLPAVGVLVFNIS